MRFAMRSTDTQILTSYPLELKSNITAHLNSEGMKVSVVVPTYSIDRYPDFKECVDAILTQTYENVEAVIVVDGNEAVYKQAQDDYGDREDTIVFCSKERSGSVSRGNLGGVLATGDIVVLTDDDAVPEDDWIERLVAAYESKEIIAAGGPTRPEWVAGKPDFLPEEYYWLIGATHKGFRETEGEVRNTFGANLSFKKEVFMELGGYQFFSNQLQATETELCTRMNIEYGQGVWYVPDAVVSHKIYEYRTDPQWLVTRAFWQGASKRWMSKQFSDSTGDEQDFLRMLLFSSIPKRVVKSLGSQQEAKQLGMLLCLTLAVGLGYIYGLLRYR